MTYQRELDHLGGALGWLTRSGRSAKDLSMGVEGGRSTALNAPGEEGGINSNVDEPAESGQSVEHHWM